jgi:hypothetical protein
LFALLLVAVLHADGLGAPDWALRPRADPLPRGVGAGIALALAPGFLLILEEIVRCRAARVLSAPPTRAGSPGPPG